VKTPIIFLATPMYGGMCSGEYTKAILALKQEIEKEGWGLSTAFIYNESLINRARNDLTKLFLESDSTHLLFIDADIYFNAKDVIRLVKEDRDIIGGLYPLKKIDWIKIRSSVLNGDSNFYKNGFNYVFTQKNNNDFFDNNEVQEVSGIGTGYMLIKREVFDIIDAETYTNNSLMFKNSEDKTTKNFFSLEIDEETNTLLSEDYYFCKSWIKTGGKVYLAPYAVAKHIGMYEFG
jgi:hypothetical protein